MKHLTKKQLDSAIKKLPEWNRTSKDTKLTRTFTFTNFVEALAFCAKILVHAEVINHHPELTISYGKVKVVLTTHDVQGLTKHDVELATRIDGIYEPC